MVDGNGGGHAGRWAQAAALALGVDAGGGEVTMRQLAKRTQAVIVDIKRQGSYLSSCTILAQVELELLHTILTLQVRVLSPILLHTWPQLSVT